MFSGGTAFGRVREASIIQEVLADPNSFGILLTGVPGSGKQELIRSLPELDGRHGPTVRLLCSPMLGAIPYGALAPMLSRNLNASSDVAALRQIFMAVRSILEEHPPGQALFIVVNEAQFIDSASAFILGQLVHSRLAKLVVVSTERHVDSISFDEFLNGAGLKHVHLDRLDVTETRQLCSLLLGGPVTRGTAMIITEQTNGNPFLVRCFIEAAHRQCLLVEHRTYWVLQKSEPEPDAMLLEAVGELHRRHRPEEQVAMELLCLAGTLPMRDLGAATGLNLESINQSSLMRFEAEDASMASSFHASVLRVAIPPGRNRELRVKCRDFPGTGGQPRYEQVRWEIESGESPDWQEIVSSAKQANDRGLHDVAWKLIQGYPRGANSADIAFERIRVLFCQADVQATSHLLIGALLPTSDEEASETPKEPRKIARWILSGMRGGFPAGKGGGITEAEVVLGYDDCRGSMDAKFISRIERSRHLYTAGNTEEACEIASTQETVEGPALLRPIRYRLRLAVLAARAATYSGQYGKAQTILDGFQFETPMDVLHAHGSLRLCAALNELSQGRLYEAQLASDEAVSELAAFDPEDLLELAFGTSSYLAKKQAEGMGPPNASVSPGEHDGPGLEPPAPMPLGNGKEADRWLARIYLELSVDEPRAGFLQRALDALALVRNHAVEREALYLCWSAGISGELTRNAGVRFMDILGPKQGKRPDAQGRLMEFANSGDVGLLKSFASWAYEQDEKVCAIEALALIVGLLSYEGSERERGVHLRQLEEWLRDFGGPPWGIAAETLATQGLTSREWQIVDLARTGMSNREIADHLTVSPRTVEGHLYRIFAKRGIRTRRELIELNPPGHRR